MLTYKGGKRAGKGTYWDLSSGKRVDLKREGTLPGSIDDTYSRIPPGLMVMFGPIVGLLYVVALPFVAIATVITVIGEQVLRGVARVTGKVIYFGWRPTEAYLAGRKRKTRGEKK